MSITSTEQFNAYLASKSPYMKELLDNQNILLVDFKEGSLTVDQAIKIAFMGAMEIQSLKTKIAELESKMPTPQP